MATPGRATLSSCSASSFFCIACARSSSAAPHRLSTTAAMLRRKLKSPNTKHDGAGVTASASSSRICIVYSRQARRRPA
eukprot:5411936-Prymnesium_polylepis.1